MCAKVFNKKIKHVKQRFLNNIFIKIKILYAALFPCIRFFVKRHVRLQFRLESTEQVYSPVYNETAENMCTV